jgi:hypothetical protein
MIELKCWHSPEGFRHVLVKPGTKYLTLLVMDGGLKIKTVVKEEERYLQDPLGGRRAWSTVCKHFAGHGRRHGTTKAAQRLLKEARRQDANQ